ncbi:tRNA pseudouridine(55) synthase TruB [Weissella diestrammenae]|uniref:tRNA pseudouridine synthase B n=1 Tax=Weissella diestrammenae TaxID=1162633 RepID=A0A7G9T5X2_9LACO|nr:tRNA pseudouridine(55) synthase TruB [Weissella diestrammenae]MCM0582327.1 tRNA pseudouridine(55) synthase TruB [Weissella diestrammenae]QNN75497.1 tRNA pseudouridine(55) synthase TruB [Weissella diestrammenae]
MDGILAVHKPSGMTSHDVVFKLRKILQMKKIGHAGTLDPSVDGVLPIALGKATKAIEFLQATGKTYVGEVTLGFATETEDLDGAEVARQAIIKPFTRQQIEAKMAELTGNITQIPPMYSAVKVNGRRLYHYARAGETVDRPERQAIIYRFELLDEPRYDAINQLQKFKFVAEVSKGTYIRTLAVDLGMKLGVPAVMSQLTRTVAGGFSLANAHTLEEIKARAAEGLGDWLRPIDEALGDLPRYELTQAQWQWVRDGKGLPAEAIPFTAPRIVYTYSGEVKSIVDWHADKQLYRPYRTFTIFD